MVVRSQHRLFITRVHRPLINDDESLGGTDMRHSRCGRTGVGVLVFAAILLVMERTVRCGSGGLRRKINAGLSARGSGEDRENQNPQRCSTGTHHDDLIVGRQTRDGQVWTSENSYTRPGDLAEARPSLFRLSRWRLPLRLLGM